ncbi:hypothetical protein [Methylophilus sp. 5]|uniref:hypothetical protein n=1 Tax=Methylophilus sp. 5 TaxID=1112274 RepID=UPI0012F921D8|nr:hypothetical protein [Methylophilus sp. 5]
MLLGTVTAAMAVITSARPDAAKQLQTIASDAVVQSACSNGTANNGITLRDCAKEK